MNKLSHNRIPPPAAPSALLKAKTAYSLWFNIYNDFPKAHRYTLGGKIEDYFLGFLENIFISIYLPSETKISRLIIAISKLDGIKFFLQIAWENKCMQDNKYVIISEALEEIGKMLGGWKKGLEKKTPLRE